MVDNMAGSAERIENVAPRQCFPCQKWVGTGYVIKGDESGFVCDSCFQSKYQNEYVVPRKPGSYDAGGEPGETVLKEKLTKNNKADEAVLRFKEAEVKSIVVENDENERLADEKLKTRKTILIGLILVIVVITILVFFMRSKKPIEHDSIPAPEIPKKEEPSVMRIMTSVKNQPVENKRPKKHKGKVGDTSNKQNPEDEPINPGSTAVENALKMQKKGGI